MPAGPEVWTRSVCLTSLSVKKTNQLLTVERVSFLLSKGKITRGSSLSDKGDVAWRVGLFSAWALTVDKRWYMYDAPFAMLPPNWTTFGLES